jgi:hypothetical protein
MHFNPTAFMSATGGVSRGERLIQRAKTDPGSFATSLRVAVDKRPKNGGPPTWRPLAIQSSDVVYIGDAVHGGILSADDTEGQDDELRLRWRNLQRKLS